MGLALALSAQLTLVGWAQTADEALPVEPMAPPAQEAAETAPAELATPALAMPSPEAVVPRVAMAISPVKLEARFLAKKFDGYQLEITNGGPHDVILLKGSVVNGVSGGEAYEQSKKKLVGVTSFLGVSGFVTTAARRKIRNNKAKSESEGFGNNWEQLPVAAGQMLSLKTLVPKGKQPLVKLIFQSKETGETVELGNS